MADGADDTRGPEGVPGYVAPDSAPTGFGAPAAPPGAGAPGYGPGYGYGAPGYGPGYGGYGYGYGYGLPPPRKTNGMAIASLVMGVGSFVFCPLIGVGGVITGYLARKRIRETGEDGAGIAMAGLVTGWIGTGLSVLMLLFYVGLGVIIASTEGASSGSRSGRPAPLATTTVPRTEPRGTRPPGSTAAPSGVIPATLCPSATQALENLLAVETADRGIVTDAARSLHTALPASYGDDIDLVLADALTRVDRDTTGSRSPEVEAAIDRLTDVIDAACPS